MARRVHKPKQDITGRTFGKLEVLWPSLATSVVRRWTCKCECGGRIDAAEKGLIAGTVRSCGCVHPATRHRMVGSREYSIWGNMRQRCENPKDESFEWYGGRGIKVCERWRDFRNFYADMGPSNGLTIDRINNDGNYQPGNCRWATWKEQAQNKRHGTRGRLFMVGDRVLTLPQMARELGISRQALHQRMQKALSSPSEADM